jgi:hypothetical protein
MPVVKNPPKPRLLRAEFSTPVENPVEIWRFRDPLP